MCIVVIVGSVVGRCCLDGLCDECFILVWCGWWAEVSRPGGRDGDKAGVFLAEVIHQFIEGPGSWPGSSPISTRPVGISGINQSLDSNQTRKYHF